MGGVSLEKVGAAVVTADVELSDTTSLFLLQERRHKIQTETQKKARKINILEAFVFPMPYTIIKIQLLLNSALKILKKVTMK